MLKQEEIKKEIEKLKLGCGKTIGEEPDEEEEESMEEEWED